MPAPSALDTQPAPEALSADADGMDLDLDISAPTPLDAVSDSVQPHAPEGEELGALELPDIESFPSGALSSAPAAEPDVSMDLPSLDEAAAAPAQAEDDGGLDFDLSLDEPGSPDAAPAVQQPAAEPAPVGFDMGSISLDLDEPTADDGAFAAGDAVDAPVSDDPMARKFELAEEFRQIGDVDGARELLQEVVENTADASLKSKAQAMLGNLG